ncbi:hypothetical protein CDAR_401361 [Caerostris darwini]|uniref:Uncharacterized protein n=1 Tax=Caerostris darwini TaxID=1538125 RepID=A0AAV4TKC1_9ARAC|nr:hypothetical protein CDAR_401361 [Caerostris darwini]
MKRKRFEPQLNLCTRIGQTGEDDSSLSPPPPNPTPLGPWCYTTLVLELPAKKLQVKGQVERSGHFHHYGSKKHRFCWTSVGYG